MLDFIIQFCSAHSCLIGWIVGVTYVTGILAVGFVCALASSSKKASGDPPASFTASDGEALALFAALWPIVLLLGLIAYLIYWTIRRVRGQKARGFDPITTPSTRGKHPGLRSIHA